MTALRRLDNTLIDRAFQPVVNRLSANPHDLAATCYAGIVGVTLARIVVEHRAGALAGNVWLYGFLAAGATVLYGMALGQRPASSGANPHRASPVSRALRLVWLAGLTGAVAGSAGRLVASGYLTPVAVLGVLSAGLWVSAVYFQACDRPPPREVRRPVAVPTTA